MKISSLVLLAVLLLVACIPGSAETGDKTASPSRPTSLPTSEKPEGCIPPQFHSDYPRGSEIYITPSPQQRILPLGWEEVSNVPENLQGNDFMGLALDRPRSGYDELWILIYADEPTPNPSNSLIYRTDTKKWTEAPIPPYEWLFLDSNKNVWAAAHSKDRRYGSELYRLNEEANQFVQVADKANELSRGNIGFVQADASGLMWFTLRFDQKNSPLFSFDPVTLEAKQRLPGNFGRFIAIDKNGNIYINHEKEEPYSKGHIPPLVLTKYDPRSNDTDSVEITRTDEETGRSESIYVDRENRLWVSDNVWIDIAGPKIGKQHAIPRSEIFIHYESSWTSFEWGRPMAMLQSADGRIWYMSEIGGAWFRPETGEWCHFTTYGSNIIEDSNHNLWMMADGNLYELKITP